MVLAALRDRFVSMVPEKLEVVRFVMFPTLPPTGTSFLTDACGKRRSCYCCCYAAAVENLLEPVWRNDEFDETCMDIHVMKESKLILDSPSNQSELTFWKPPLNQQQTITVFEKSS